MGLVDIHIHADSYNTNRNGRPARHGETPDRIAEAVIDKGLDGYVVLAHQSPTAEFFKVEEEIEKLTQNTTKQIWGILGMESVFHHGAQKFHLGFLYDKNYSEYNLPAPFDQFSGLKGLEQYLEEYPGAVILYHPGLVLKKKDIYCENTILDLCKSGLIDGVEILNGSVIYRGATVDRELALAVLLKDDLAICGGSDAHDKSYVGMCSTGFGADATDSEMRAEPGSEQMKAMEAGITSTLKADSPEPLNIKDNFFKSIRNKSTWSEAVHPEQVKNKVRDELLKFPSWLDDYVKVG